MAGQSLIGNLAVNLVMETAAFEKGADYSEKRLTKMAKKFEAIGKGWVDFGQKLSVGLTLPIAAFGVTAVKAAAESQDALGQVEAALTSMGNASGRTADQLAGLAEGLMRNSLYDDDEILRKVTANLLTFGNVAGKQFDQAQQAAVDLAARMGTDLQSAALMVGKALNDPLKGLQALRRVGIQFTDQQKEQITAMAEAGDMAGAQTVMLKELERQFGNSAKAARAADPLAALKQSFAEFQETVGGHLLKVLPAITGAIEKVLGAFSQLSPGMQQTLIIVAGLAAAFGPLLIGLGTLVQLAAPILAVFSAISTAGGVMLAVQSVIAGFAAVLGPAAVVIAALAAAGALIYANWEKIAPVLEEFWSAAQAALGPALQDMIASITTALGELWNGPLGEGIRRSGQQLVELSLLFIKAFGPVLIAVLKATIETLTNVFRIIGDGIRLVSALLKGDWSTAWSAALSIVDRLFGGLPSKIAAIVSKIVPVIRTWVVDKLNAVWDLVREKIDQVKGWFYGLYDAVVGHSYVPDMVDGIADQMARLDAVMVEPAKTAAERTKAHFQKLRDDLKGLLDELYPKARELVEFRKNLAIIDDNEKAKKITPDQAKQYRRDLIFKQVPTDSLEQVEGSVAKAGDAVAGWADKAKKANEQVKQSFADMAQDVTSSLQNLASSIKGGGVLDIFGSVLDLLLQLGSFGVFGKGIQTNLNTAKFGGFRAAGGPVVPGKSYIVGENGPEWFTPGSAGGIAPMRGDGGMRIAIEAVPNPYFDVRVSHIAAPIAGAAGMHASKDAQSSMARRRRRVIPG